MSLGVGDEFAFSISKAYPGQRRPVVVVGHFQVVYSFVQFIDMSYVACGERVDRLTHWFLLGLGFLVCRHRPLARIGRLN